MYFPLKSLNVPIASWQAYTTQRKRIVIDSVLSLALPIQCVNMLLVKLIKMGLLCFVHDNATMIASRNKMRRGIITLWIENRFNLPKLGFVEKCKQLTLKARAIATKI